MRRILIDECINPRLALRLRLALPKYHIDTVRELNWTGVSDETIVARVNHDYDVLITIDQGFAHQHNRQKLVFSIVILKTLNNQMPSFERLLNELAEILPKARPGQVYHISDPIFLSSRKR